MTNNRASLYLVLMVAMLFTSLPALVSCNKDKDDDNSTYSYSESEQTTLVTGFALQADADVLASLDSVHFTIDYNNGLIYNADSLPVGTDISALKVTVDFLNTVNMNCVGCLIDHRLILKLLHTVIAFNKPVQICLINGSAL